MEKSVERFNEEYYDDLDLLGFKQLHCDGDGKVDISEICAIRSLSEAFFRIADRSAFGYEIKSDENGNVRINANGKEFSFERSSVAKISTYFDF